MTESPIRKIELLRGIMECCSMLGQWEEVAVYQQEYFDLALGFRDVQASTIDELIQSLKSKSVELESEKQWSTMFKNQRDLEGKIRQTESEKSRLRYVLVCVLILLSSLLAISYQKRISVGKQAASQKQIEAILRKTNKQWKETFDGLEDAAPAARSDIF